MNVNATLNTVPEWDGKAATSVAVHVFQKVTSPDVAMTSSGACMST